MTHFRGSSSLVFRFLRRLSDSKSRSIIEYRIWVEKGWAGVGGREFAGPGLAIGWAIISTRLLPMEAIVSVTSYIIVCFCLVNWLLYTNS